MSLDGGRTFIRPTSSRALPHFNDSYVASDIVESGVFYWDRGTMEPRHDRQELIYFLPHPEQLWKMYIMNV